MNETKDFFSHGCRWLRADFHLHTRKDHEFFFIGEDDKFISMYVEALKTSGIEIGVITNHNKFDLGEFKALRKNAQREGIYLLPGIELSVNDGANGIHTLVVFHEDWIDKRENNDFINQFLNITFAGIANYETRNGRSKHGLIETFNKLNEFDKDYFVIFAHVDQESGLWNEMSGGRLREIVENKYFRERTLGFQKVRDRNKSQNIKDCLGEYYPAEVEGSDPKCLEEIGKNETTYLKIGDFNYDAVKFALQDHQNRVKKEPTKTNHSHIFSIRFEGGILEKQTISFNSGLNCLIGIRGSGKSAILEAIRYTLDIPFGLKAQDQKYKEELVRYCLGSGGKTILTAIDRHGQKFEIHRILGKTPDVYIEGELKPGINITSTIINKPIYFGQKDLASTGEGFERDLVEKLVGGKLDNVRKQIEDQKTVVINLIQKLDKMKNLEEQEKEWLEKKNGALLKLDFLKKHGIDEEKLQRPVNFDADILKCEQIIDIVNNFLESSNELIEKYEDDITNMRNYESRENPVFFKDFYTILDRIITSLKNFKATHQSNHQDRNALDDKLKYLINNREQLKEEFATFERELSQQFRDEKNIESIRPDEFITLNKTLNRSNLMLEELIKSRKTRETTRAELLRAAEELNNFWQEEFRHIDNEISKINDSQDSLQIKVEFKGDKEEFIKCMKNQFRGSGLRESFFNTIVQQYSDFICIYNDNQNFLNIHGNKASDFLEYLNQNLSSLLTWQPPNRYTIEYRGKELKHHSLGQRASALILFILSQRDNDLIIIDQPEDDLDNQTIYEDVIKVIKSIKSNNQFIFATHNANFPVLGDAEQIIACSFSDNHVLTRTGSIDRHHSQDAIVSIMEGGREAFLKRKEIYQLWKQ
ncbi:MAG: histidinol-phosphatase [Candidatus Omnitrophota bacterium]|nr:MAG: histidinol-phosphatase [Candidatus Omnitrophota bacterium]